MKRTASDTCLNYADAYAEKPSRCPLAIYAGRLDHLFTRIGGPSRSSYVALSALTIMGSFSDEGINAPPSQFCTVRCETPQVSASINSEMPESFINLASLFPNPIGSFPLVATVIYTNTTELSTPFATSFATPCERSVKSFGRLYLRAYGLGGVR